jgi:hypothetical protein
VRERECVHLWTRGHGVCFIRVCARACVCPVSGMRVGHILFLRGI